MRLVTKVVAIRTNLIIEAMRPRRSDAGEGYYQHVILTFDSLLL